MQTKTEQLEELKATAAKLQQQIEALEKPKQWEPKYNIYTPSESKAMRIYSRLVAYVREYGSDWEANWEDWKQEKCYVYLNPRNHELSQKWKWSRSFNECIGGTVYMSRDCAEGLVAKLNSGEVVL